MPALDAPRPSPRSARDAGARSPASSRGHAAAAASSSSLGSGRPASAGARLLPHTSSFSGAEFVEADDDVADAEDNSARAGVDARARAGAAAVAPLPLRRALSSPETGAIRQAARPLAADTAAADARPHTAIGASAGSEQRATAGALRLSRSLAGVDLRDGGKQSSRAGVLGTIPEANAVQVHPGLLLSRGGLHRPKSAVIFALSRRPSTEVGNGATVPFHYTPPPLTARDVTTLVKNAPLVPFTVATRDQWVKTHMSTGTSATAGPGAYDTNVDAMSTKRVSRTQSFTMAARKLGADSRGGPAPYNTSEAMKSFQRQLPRPATFPTALRPGDKTQSVAPGPILVSFVEKYRPHFRFSTAIGHDVPAPNVDTASIPIRDADRVKKHVPARRFSSTERFGSSASSF